jgi:hypothetical protein
MPSQAGCCHQLTDGLPVACPHHTITRQYSSTAVQQYSSTAVQQYSSTAVPQPQEHTAAHIIHLMTSPAGDLHMTHQHPVQSTVE